MSDGLALSATFSLKTYFLVLTYEVKNAGKRDAYLLNRLYSPTPRWKFDPNLIYVYLQAEKSTIWLAKKIAAIPPDRSVLSPDAPFVTPLRAGTAFTEEVNIPLPLREYREYSALAPASPEPRQLIFSQVYFTLDYYWAMKGIREEVRTVAGQKVVVPWLPPGVFPEFGQAASEMRRINVAAVMP